MSVTLTRNAITRENLGQTIDELIAAQPVYDIHTHLFAPVFGDLLLYGVDELLTYHYLVAELFRKTDLSYNEFWAMSKTAQADLIWQTLFIDNSPISEACRGVVTTLQALGFDPKQADLNEFRRAQAAMSAEEYVNRVFDLANIHECVMTNDPFDSSERKIWLGAGSRDARDIDARFHAALRIDVLLNQYHERARSEMKADGYQVDNELSDRALAQARRFLSDWVARMKPKYMAVSLPPDFVYPEDSARSKLIQYAVLPVCREANIPFALMIGVTRAVQPALKLAGDGLGKADLSCIENLCREHGENKFLVTLLSRENQHELCVLGRKFRNLMIFGCWWFLNNPSIIDEMTRERLELLGLSMVPQHSDARVLDQVIYKWKHSKKIIGRILTEKYGDLLDSGWALTTEEIRRDVANLFGGNFARFVEG